MRRYFDKTLARLRAFVDQREILLLLVQAEDEHGLVVLRQLESIAEVSPHIFWAFAEAFVDARSYAATLVEAFRNRVSLMNEKLEKKGKSWPPLPPVALDATVDPVTRIRALTVYARERIPDLEISHLVLALLPSTVSDPLAFRLFLRRFTAYVPLSPWCHHVRVLAREPAHVSTAGLPSHLREELALDGFPSTEVLPIDLSPMAVQTAIREEIDDESVPIEQRAQCLFIEANTDVSHRRYSEALEKLKELIAFYEGPNPMMHAASMNAMAEAVRGLAGFERAIPSFEAALEAAMRAQSLPLMLNVSLNLAHGHFAAKRWAQAAEYYEAADAAAGATLNVEVKLQCLDRLGICHVESASYGAAQRAWLGGRELARVVKHTDFLRTFLDHLLGLYRAARMKAEVEAFEREIAALD